MPSVVRDNTEHLLLFHLLPVVRKDTGVLSGEEDKLRSVGTVKLTV